MKPRVGVTGHRPGKLGGYEFYAPGRIYVRAEIERALRLLDPSELVSGMALGVDTDAFCVAVSLGIPVIAAVPFVGQERLWKREDQRRYMELLTLAKSIIVVSPGEYSPAKMQVRNEWMVDNSDHMLAVFDGSRGGTFNCVQYARRCNKPMTVIPPLQTFAKAEPFSLRSVQVA